MWNLESNIQSSVEWENLATNVKFLVVSKIKGWMWNEGLNVKFWVECESNVKFLVECEIQGSMINQGRISNLGSNVCEI